MNNIPYVRAHTFATVDEARAVYQRIHATCVGPDKDYDLGAVTALWESRTPCVIVTAFRMPPLEVQAQIATILAATHSGHAWTPPQELVDSIALRRVRQLIAKEGTVQPSGLRLVEHSGMYTQVDRFGNDVP